MEEARRFLRYVIPGLVFTVEVAIYLSISAPDKIPVLVGLFANLGAPLTLFIASGGLGFLLASIYYCTLEIPMLSNLQVDHRPLIADARARGWLRLIFRNHANNSETEVNSPLSRDGAWRVVTALWHERIGSSKRIKGANKRTDNLVDILHGLGTACVGSFIAFFVWMLIHRYLQKSLPAVPYWFIPLAVVVILYVNFKNVKSRTESVISKILMNELGDPALKNEVPKVYVDPWDLDC